MGYLWNPWHGCHKCSAGCLNCYVFYLDKTRDKNADIVTKSKRNFNLPLKKDREGNFKIPSYTEVATCFTSDFFLEEADEWRSDAWNIIKSRSDVNFLISTKRIKRAKNFLPNDWGKGYPNVIFATSCENQKAAEERLPYLMDIPCVKRYVLAAPLLEYVDFSEFLKSGKIDRISVGGESYENARPCEFMWVEKIYKTCFDFGVKFDFHQTGSNFIKDGKTYRIKHREEYAQAKKGFKYLQDKYGISE